MAGIANDYLIYPILDLIRGELRKAKIGQSTASEIDPFAGTPSAVLFRDNPADPERLTGVVLDYPTGYSVEINLVFGSDDPTSFPIGINSEDSEWGFYKSQRLTSVSTVALNPALEPLVTHVISLNYDGRGLLIGTTVERI